MEARDWECLLRMVYDYLDWHSDDPEAVRLEIALIGHMLQLGLAVPRHTECEQHTPPLEDEEEDRHT